jgi:hypothetical protein
MAEIILKSGASNGFDNRKANLRFCTNTENIRNQTPNPSKGTSRFKGVYWNKRRNSWSAQIVVDGKKIRRSHADERAAAKCYDSLAKEYYGEFARVNFA